MRYFFDLLFVILILPILIFVSLIIFLLIKINEPKSRVFFTQDRLGKNGKIFKCYKFRSMRENSEQILQEYLAKNPNEVENYAKFHKFNHDPRVTKIGQILRKTSLDEIPQFFNVLKGQMSVVGPRPYLVGEFETGKISQKDGEKILSVMPGITGFWQINGRNDVDFQERAKMDLWYVENRNFVLDFKIILKTILIVLKMSGR